MGRRGESLETLENRKEEIRETQAFNSESYETAADVYLKNFYFNEDSKANNSRNLKEVLQSALSNSDSTIAVDLPPCYSQLNHCQQPSTEIPFGFSSQPTLVSQLQPSPTIHKSSQAHISDNTAVPDFYHGNHVLFTPPASTTERANVPQPNFFPAFTGINLGELNIFR